MQRRSQHQIKPVSTELCVVEALPGKNCATARQSRQGALDEKSGEEGDDDEDDRHVSRFIISEDYY